MGGKATPTAAPPAALPSVLDKRCVHVGKALVNRG